MRRNKTCSCLLVVAHTGREGRATSGPTELPATPSDDPASCAHDGPATNGDGEVLVVVDELFEGAQRRSAEKPKLGRALLSPVEDELLVQVGQQLPGAGLDVLAHERHRGSDP